MCFEVLFRRWPLTMQSLTIFFSAPSLLCSGQREKEGESHRQWPAGTSHLRTYVHSPLHPSLLDAQVRAPLLESVGQENPLG